MTLSTSQSKGARPPWVSRQCWAAVPSALEISRKSCLQLPCFQHGYGVFRACSHVQERQWESLSALTCSGPTTGLEQSGSPTTIHATLRNATSQVTFNPAQYKERAICCYLRA